MVSKLWQSRAFAESYGHAPIQLVRGSGDHLFDTAGRAYINAYSGLSLPFGYGNPDVLAAIRRQAESLPYAALNCCAAEVTEAYAVRLAEFVPGGDWSALFTNSASEAVDAALRIVDILSGTGHHRTPVVLSFSHSYHGQTLGALSISGVSSSYAPSFKFPVCSVPSPIRGGDTNGGYSYGSEGCGCAAPLARAFESHSVGAVFVEPVVGAGGVYPLPDTFWRHLGALAAENGSLVIMDESATAPGRLGTAVGFEKLPIRPDLVIVGKGINSGYLPIGAVLMSERVATSLAAARTPLFSCSQGGNSIACAAGLATLKILEETDTIHTTGPKGDLLARLLTDVSRDIAVRHSGLLVGLDFPPDRFAPSTAVRVRDAMRDAGALVYARGNFMGMFPSLTVSPATLEELATAFAAAFNIVCQNREH